ncbi:MAG: GNAT family N-acetyltransferase, partial [Chloroflexota bacterium]
MTPNISLTPSNPVELSNFMALEQHPDAAEYVTQNSLKEHLAAFFEPDITYLTIEKDDVPAGFLLLALDIDGLSVELKRIVVNTKESGVGQVAMQLLEGYVRDEIGRSRIWLDVFTTNSRAIHVYKKLGYTEFDTDFYPDGRPLILFE